MVFCKEPNPGLGEIKPTDETACFWWHSLWGPVSPSALSKLKSRCCHLACRCHSRFLTSIALHITFCGFTIEKYWPRLSKTSKIWACAVDFLFFFFLCHFLVIPITLFQSCWAEIFRQLFTVYSFLFLCMARKIFPTYINLCLLRLRIDCGFIAWLLSVRRISHNYSHSGLDLKILDNF